MMARAEERSPALSVSPVAKVLLGQLGLSVVLALLFLGIRRDGFRLFGRCWVA